MIPGDCESTVIEAEDSETKKELRIEEATGKPRQGCFGSLKM